MTGTHDPMSLSPSERDYYRSTWGFDPVTDCRILGMSHCRYEESFPLPQDPPLQAAGVIICAHVDWKGEMVHNRIIFRRTDAKGRQREASVECTHTVVYAGPASDALSFVDDLIASDDLSENTRRPAILPPWEHFAALKSYVAGIADMGVLTILQQSVLPITNSTSDLPFGFNATMHVQVEKAIFAIAPKAMLSVYRDFTRELLDTHTPSELVDRRVNWPTSFTSTSKRKPWEYFLRHLDAPLLIYWFRHTGIADDFQDRLFTKPALLAKAQAIAPGLPWDALRLEWEAREEAERFRPPNLNLNHVPPAEVWARTPFCDYTFPSNILSPDSTNARRSRVQAFLRELTKAYSEGGPMETETFAEEYLEWAQGVSAHLDDYLTTPFPADRVRPEPISHYDPMLKQYAGLTPAEVVDSLERGNHRQRRNVVLCYPIPPELQEKLAAHWDFATRLALVGNPGTMPSMIATLAQDPQPCVRLATAERVRRGAATIEPRFGEIFDPGELVWLLSSHPGIFFQFGVTAWGDGSDAYHDWYKTKLRAVKNRIHYDATGDGLYDGPSPGLYDGFYDWVYSEGIFLEDSERGPQGSHLAYCGLTAYACGQLPCLYLGLPWWSTRQGGPLNRLDL